MTAIPLHEEFSLKLPGVTDRRNINAFTNASCDVSAEVGSSPCIDSSPGGPLAAKETSSHVRNARSGADSTRNAHSIHNYNQAIVDDDEATPENRLLHCLHGRRNSAGPQLETQPRDGELQPTSGNNVSLFIPHMRNVRTASPRSDSPSDSDAHSNCATENSQRSGGLAIPGLISVHESECSFPWRVKYVPSSTAGIPCTNECLTDATTADGNPDYEDDECFLSDSESSSYSDSDLGLPPGVFKKVRFLPLQESAVSFRQLL